MQRLYTFVLSVPDIVFEPVLCMERRRREIANLILAMCMQMLQNGCRKNKINFPKVEIKI